MSSDKDRSDNVRFILMLPLLPFIVLLNPLLVVATAIAGEIFGSRAVGPLAEARPGLWLNLFYATVAMIVIGIVVFAAGL